MHLDGWINCGGSLVPEIVLVEDDDQVRSIWLTVAIRLNYRFATYSTPENFMADLHRFTEETQFFLDQDFGERRGVGVLLASHIRRRLRSSIFLVTSYPRDCFEGELKAGKIDDVFSKYPWPFTTHNAFSSDQSHLEIKGSVAP